MKSTAISIDLAELDAETKNVIASWAGRLVGDIGDVCRTTGKSDPTVRRKVATGDIAAFRTARNGKLQFRAREVARFILASERKHSLPVNPDLSRRLAATDDGEDDEQKPNGRRRRKGVAK